MGGMIYWLYEQLLLRQLTTLPEQICFFITAQDMADAPEKLMECTIWCREISEAVRDRDPRCPDPGITGVMFHINTTDPLRIEPCLPYIRKLASIARLTLHLGDTREQLGSGMQVTVAIGKSGRQEIIDCIRRMEADGIQPEQVDEHLIESCLTFPYTPDLVIKTGGDYLTDFLIWQSVYSELFFSDVNWKYFRKVDFLRALRDYQSRIRRFGR
jgi:undecaprenyl diphosphate synthase